MSTSFGKKKAPPPLTAEQILGVLNQHRPGGSHITAEGHFILCYCGQKFQDAWGVDGSRALRVHIAEEIAKLQTKGT